MAVVDGEKSCYVASFKDEVSEDLIEELFTQVGPVTKVLMKTLPKTDQRYALVEFEDEDSVIFAIETLDGIKLFDCPLVVKPRNGTNQEEIWRRTKGDIERRQRSNPVPQASSSSANRSTHQRAPPQPYSVPDRHRNRSSYQSQYSTPQASSYNNQHHHHHSAQRQYSAPSTYQGGNSYRNEYTPRRPQPQQHYGRDDRSNHNQSYDSRHSGGGRYNNSRSHDNWR